MLTKMKKMNKSKHFGAHPLRGGGTFVNMIVHNISPKVIGSVKIISQTVSKRNVSWISACEPCKMYKKHNKYEKT